MPSQLAWWMMSQKEKDALQKARERGQFGGIAGKAPYMWIQEGSTIGGGTGAAKAGIKPKRFIEKSIDEGHQEFWFDIIYDVLRRIGT